MKFAALLIITTAYASMQQNPALLCARNPDAPYCKNRLAEVETDLVPNTLLCKTNPSAAGCTSVLAELDTNQNFIRDSNSTYCK